MTRRDRIEDQLAYIIASVNRQLEEEIEEKLKPEGIPIEQFRILGALASRDGQSMGELAALVLVDATTLTKIIDRMVSDSLVYRAPSPTDRRKVLIFMGRQGEVLQRRLSGLVRDQQERILARLDHGKAEELKAMLMGLVRQ